jgi:heme/copper-type cytochrome/quinol oxidase subunit 1
VLNVLSTAGAAILAIGYLLPAVYFLWSLKYGKIAEANPLRGYRIAVAGPIALPTDNFLESQWSRKKRTTRPISAIVLKLWVDSVTAKPQLPS